MSDQKPPRYFWSRAEDNFIIQHVGAGMTIENLAPMMRHRSKPSLIRRSIHLGVNKTARRLAEEKSPAKIAYAGHEPGAGEW